MKLLNFFLLICFCANESISCEGRVEEAETTIVSETLDMLAREQIQPMSLDELPELWNVLKGDMSLVGPRPLLIEYLDLYTPEQARRHDVRPGITGWAQVNGRNTLGWEERFQLDVWYVDHRSFWLDLRIILMTLSKVIAREGISAAGEATMPKFKGSSPGRKAP